MKHSPRTWSLAAKLGAIGGVLLLLALASIGLTLWVTWQLEGGAAAVNEAGRMRMLTWRMAQSLPVGDARQLANQVQRFEQTLTLLRQGEPSRPLFVPQDALSQQAFAQVQQGWQQLRQAWLAPQPPSGAQVALQAEQFVGHVDDFVTAIETQLARWTSVLNAFQFALVALAICSAVALLYSAYLFVFNPLARLQAGLARVGEGDFSARVEVDSRDEFGALSEGFNQMAHTLQGLYQNLEQRVQEKTLGLETERARLAALYEAAAFVATATSLEDLAQGFARQLRSVGQADASAVRWSNESNQRYLLLAADGLPDALVHEEHCLPTGHCHCGQVAGQAQTRVIPIQPAQGPASLCQQAGFSHVVSVPVRLHERLVGEFNLFYHRAAQVSPEDRALLEALASHLAGAIEGLRAGALEREAAVAEERSLLASELHDSIAQSLSFLKIQSSLLRDAIRLAQPERVDQTLAELDAGIRGSLADVRELLLHFRTRAHGEDIAPALRTTLTKFEHQTGLPTHLSIEGEGLPLPPDVQLQVLHVVQEALSNVRKHAQARQVWVEVQQGAQWRVEVRDDGLGFDDGPAGPDETHVGLRIMRERAARIGATVDVASVPGAGTCVVLTVPTSIGS